MGGNSSFISSVFFRSVKNPTIAGTRIRRNDRHSKAKPTVGESVCCEVPVLFVTSMGVPVAISAPHTQVSNAAHPQMKAVMPVAIIPVVLFCISIAP